MVVECDRDDISEAEWLTALVLLRLPIVSIVSSGDRLAHALVHIGAGSNEEWNARRNELLPDLVRIGADVSSLSAVQLTRLPCCERLGARGCSRQLPRISRWAAHARALVPESRRRANHGFMKTNIEDDGGAETPPEQKSEPQQPDSTRPVIVFPSAAKRPSFACYDEAFFVGNKLHKAGVYYFEVERKKDEDGDVVESH